ncbi:MAG TPA: dihydroorotase [Spirochaetaceae bacterium]|nr:dihydroorotase [Spirochaetaceae bacterium]
MIDPHVHLRDWGQSQADTIAHALRIAEKCGFTHLFDMPNTVPETVTSLEAFKKRIRTADEAGVHGIEYHTYIGLTGEEGQIFDAMGICQDFFPKAIGLKLFLGPSTGNLEVCNEDALARIFEALSNRKYKGVLAVHCEDKRYFRPALYDASDFSTHSIARPPESEWRSVEAVIGFASKNGFEGVLHIAHVSCAQSVKIIKEKRKALPKMRITFGVTPHHALLTCEDAKDGKRLLKVNPPLRSSEDRRVVFESLLDGTADWIESDHAPHTLADKAKGASGIPGFAGFLHLIATLRKAGITRKRLEELVCTNAAKTFGISTSERDIQIPEDCATLCREAQEEYSVSVYDGL